MIIVVPRHPDRDGRISRRAARAAQWRAIEHLQRAGGSRVAVYDLENEQGTPIYIHAKAVVIDDMWAMVGSANLNRRSWTHDSEVACAVVDQRPDLREPAAGFGAWQATAARLQAWHQRGRVGPGPRGAPCPMRCRSPRLSRPAGCHRCTGSRSTPTGALGGFATAAGSSSLGHRAGPGSVRQASPGLKVRL